MLRFESVTWATQNSKSLKSKLESLGFLVNSSRREDLSENIFFGPDAIEIVPENDAAREGVITIGLETDHIAQDYEKIKKRCPDVEKPRRSNNSIEGTPNWYGFNVPESLTSDASAWAVMNSNNVLKSQTNEILPLKHPNSSFGIEALHLVSKNSLESMKKWSQIFEKPFSHLKWNEIVKTDALRLQTNERFFDVLNLDEKSLLSAGSGFRTGVFMLTIKVSDLELAKGICSAAGAKITECHNRDGFIVPHEFTGGPALRFVRTFWKRYLPKISENFPEGRRADKFRPLGGAHTSTLRSGFTDDWSH
jgi:hypothetical protein